jgi:hypothetical protein
VRIGDRVYIVGIQRAKETIGNDVTCDFEFFRGNTGTIVDIDRTMPRGHQPKVYSIELDKPNRGILRLTGTANLERIK